MGIRYALILLPLAFVFSFRNKVKLNMFSLFIFLIFCDGLIQLLLPASYFTGYKIGLLLYIAFILFYSILKKSGFISKKTPALLEFSLFLLSLLIVISIQGTSTSSLITFIRVPLMGYIFFIIFYNSGLKPDLFSQFLLLIKRLLILQILAALLKYYMIGLGEKPVTTISATGGASAVILPVMLSVIVLAIYLFWLRDRRIFLLLPLILFIGFANSKRGIWIFLPAFMIITFSFWYIFRHGWSRSLPYLSFRLPFIIFSGLIIFYFGVRLNRSLNPDNKIWGRFDYEYAVNYIREYNADEDYYEKNKLVKGRQAGLQYTLSQFISSPSLKTTLFGIGPDKIIAQQHHSEDIRSTGIESRGSMTGLVQDIWAIGLVPVSIFLLFYLKLFRFSFNSFNHYRNNENAMFPFIAVIFCLLSFIDYVFYTKAFVNIPAIQILFYSVLAFSCHLPAISSSVGDQKIISKVVLYSV